jgi:hypothetical protein
MGMDQTVTFAGKTIPTWPAVRHLLAGRGFAVQMRMIDGQLAFPDEEPPEEWRELRLGTPQGMVTLRRGTHEVVFVTWGNADQALRQAWNALAWAFAEAGGGHVLTPEGVLDAAAFARQAELPAALRPGGDPT